MEEIVHIQGGQYLTKLVRIKLFIYRCYQKKKSKDVCFAPLTSIVLNNINLFF